MMRNTMKAVAFAAEEYNEGGCLRDNGDKLVAAIAIIVILLSGEGGGSLRGEGIR